MKMNENVLVKAKFKKNYLSLILFGLAVVLAAVSFAIANDIYMNKADRVHYGFGIWGDNVPYSAQYRSVFDFYVEEFFINAYGNAYCYCIIAAVVFAVAALITFLLFRCELVVTDRRVYGKAAFGKRIDLPMGKISSIGLGANLFSSIAVATSSGKLQFYLLENREEVYQTISDEIAKAEPIPVAAAPKTDSAPAVSAADELKKYKELLDTGVITQEEFDAKKKQLLGL